MTTQRWQLHFIHQTTQTWLSIRRKRYRFAHEAHPWWPFVFAFDAFFKTAVAAFLTGCYQFQPMTEYQSHGELVRVWTFPNKLVLHWLYQIIKPVIKHLISPLCHHPKGPQGVKAAIRCVHGALNSHTKSFRYVLRLDIKSYYASIRHDILLTMLKQHFQDPRLLYYFNQIITTAVDRGGDVFLPNQGIPIRSTLSPFFGALYLAPLDRAFEKRPHVFYARFMDDILILTQSAAAFKSAKRTLFRILRSLKLTLSPAKSLIKKLDRKGFHFLGMHFGASQNDQSSKPKSSVTLHPRSCARALAKVNALSLDAGHPATMQRYLARWGAWWASIIPSVRFTGNLFLWTHLAKSRGSPLAWLGAGLVELNHVRVTLDPLWILLYTQLQGIER